MNSGAVRGTCARQYTSTVCLDPCDNAPHGALQVYGVLNFYSLETGRMLEKEALTAPQVDGSVCFDWGNSLVWYASNSAQALCWHRAFGKAVHNLVGQPLQPEAILATPAFTMPDDPPADQPMELVGLRVLACCDLLCRSYVPNTDTLYLYKDMYLDAHQVGVWGGGRTRRGPGQGVGATVVRH